MRTGLRSAVLVAAGAFALRTVVRLRAAPTRPVSAAADGGDTGACEGAPVWEPAALAALAAWQPAPPRTVLQRIAGLVWAAPLSVAGLIAGAGSLRRPVVRDGVLLFAPARGLTAAALRWRGFAAAALGHVVLALEEPSPALLTHELMHVRQAERLGILMAPAYLGMMLPYGYRRHPLERAARRAAAGKQAAAGEPTV